MIFEPTFISQIIREVIHLMYTAETHARAGHINEAVDTARIAYIGIAFIESYLGPFGKFRVVLNEIYYP